MNSFNPFLEGIESYRFDSTYRRGNAGWDIGRPQKAISWLLNSGEIRGDVIDIGCGTGIHSIIISQRGHRVLGVDFSTTAIEHSKRNARRKEVKVDFLVMNALKLSFLNLMFDTAVDSACFHCLNQVERDEYERQVGKILKPGGTLFLLCSSNSVNLDEINKRFNTGWKIHYAKETIYEYTHSTIEAYLIKIQKS